MKPTKKIMTRSSAVKPKAKAKAKAKAKVKGPTLKGRLSQPLTSRLEALRQLKATMPLSPVGEKVLQREEQKAQEAAKPVNSAPTVRKSSSSFEKEVNIQGMPLKDQINLIFNPLHNMTNTPIEFAPTEATYIVPSSK